MVMCDHSNDCTRDETVLIVQRRPSNQADLCCILAFCEHHEPTYIHDFNVLAEALKDSRSPVAASRKAIGQLFETGEAAKIGILWDMTL